MVKTGFNWNRECPRFLADMTGNGRCDIVGFGIDGVWVAKSDGSGGFLPPERVCSGFALHKGSWRVDQHVRVVGQVKGPQLLVSTDMRVAAGRTPLPAPGSSHRSILGTTVSGTRSPDDLLGFGDDGVYIAFNSGPNMPWPVQGSLSNFGVQESWRVDRDVRMLADLTGQGRDSIVGFGEEGTWIALNDGHGGFGTPKFFPDFGFTEGWRLDRHPRFAADLNGTGCADLVGFGNDGVYVAFNDGKGGFAPPVTRVTEELSFNRGWGAEHPRFAARLTQNRRADLVGFGNDGVWAAFNNGPDGTFTPRTFTSVFVLKDYFALNKGWNIERHLRFVADLTGKGQADLVGFGEDAVWVSLNDGKGGFGPAQPYVNDLCYNQGWRVGTHPRFLADVTGNGLPDVVGFGDDGVWVALNNGKGGFGTAKFVLNDFGSKSVPVIDHVFVLIMENRSFDHMLGFSKITGTDAVTGQPTAIDGLTGNECNTPDGSDCSSPGAKPFRVYSPADDTMPTDPGHDFIPVLIQLAGYGAEKRWVPGGPYLTPNNSGFVASYATRNPALNPGEIMRCFSPEQLPVLYALAREFVVCDAWFSSLPGPTFPNRMFAHAASSGGYDEQPGGSDIAAWELVPGDGFSFQNGTIFDRLRHAGLGFRVYGTREPPWSVDAKSPFPMVASLSGMSIDSVLDLQITDEPPYPGYNRLVQDLPNQDFVPVRYIHIEPSYGFLDKFKYGKSQHPLSGAAQGDYFIKMIYEAIRNSPVWERSLFIITWDEHGGFYDHVPPPAAVPPGDRPTGPNKNGFRFDRLGARVPAVIISPWIPKNLIDHRVYDHASIPATIEELFGLDPLTDRDRNANSLSSLLTLMAPRTDAPKTVGPRFGIEPTPRTSPVAPPNPQASINEPDTVPFLAVLVARDLQASSPAERAAIFQRVREIKTQADAWVYLKEVEQKVAARRAGQPQPKS
jgi:phospholipase C